MSVCLSGLIVAAFGFLSSAAMVRLARERIDRELRALTDSQVRKSQPGGHWRRFWESLRTIYGPMAQEQYAVEVVRMGGGAEYVSPNWPEDLTDDVLPVLGPVPPQAEGEEAGGRGEEERPRRGGRARPFESERSRREPPRKLPATDPVFATLEGAGKTWRVIRMGNEEVTVSVGMDLSDLHAEDGSENQRELVALLEEVQRLKTIVHKLLLLSQADAGRMPLSSAQIDLAEPVNTARDDLEMLAPRATVEVEAETGVSVSADPALLGQVLDNLTSNAAKFVDEGGTIRLRLTRDKGNAVFTISNTGSGIPKEDHERVFDRFYRVDKSRSREVEGAGLGLSLAREIARAHGGDLLLVRSDGRETIFALVLPLVSNALCTA